MWVIAGLGNPGFRYQESRHNLGFMLANRLAKSHSIRFNQERWAGLAGKGRIVGHEVLLVKPQTYMNDSGRCLRLLSEDPGLDTSKLLVVHDDLDLPLGHLRVKASGSSGGHNGLKSIIEELGTRQFARLRIGIDHPPPGVSVIDHVLGAFSRDERKVIDEALEQAEDIVGTIIAQGVQQAMNEYNKKVE